MLLAQQVDDLAELSGIFELSVNGRKAHVGNVVEAAEVFHNHLADIRRRHFFIQPVCESPLGVIGDILQFLLGDITLLTGDSHRTNELVAIKMFAPVLTVAIGLFYDHELQLFDGLKGRKPPLARLAFTTPLDGFTVPHGAGVKDGIVVLTTKWTLHELSSLAQKMSTYC